MKATIEINVEEFDDFLYQTLDDLIVKHGGEITEYLRGFLIGVGYVNITYTNGQNAHWDF